MDSKRHGIQADKPIPPWERPGCFRLDCEPHRGKLLWWLSCGSYVLGVLALMIPCGGWAPGLIGIPLNLVNCYLTSRDLVRMRAGLMDPTGQGVTRLAASLSRLGIWFSLAATAVWGGAYLLFTLLESR